ncbi:MAG TPA: hypothetical protein VF796_28085 [Humisphaera sp.]
MPDVAPPARPSDRLLAWVDRYRYWVFGLLLAAYAAGFNGHWRLEPDSALYLTIGRNLVEGNGYTFLGKDHRLAYPGVPLLFAGLFKAFGTNSLLPHLTMMWLMGVACLGLVYRLFLLHAGRPTAVLMTLGVGLSRVFYRYTFELLTDLPFLLGVTAFLVGYEAVFYRRQHAGHDGEPAAGESAAGYRFDIRAVWFDGVLMLVGLGLAVATRPSMWALLAAAVGAAAWSLLALVLRAVRERRVRRIHVVAVAVHLLVALVVVLAVSLFYLRDPRQQKFDPSSPGSTNYVEEDRLFHLGSEQVGQMVARAGRGLAQVLDDGLSEAAFGTPIKIPGLRNYPGALLGAVVVTAGVLLARERPLWGFWVLATVLMVTQVPKPVDRYFLPVIPVTVYAWWRTVRWAEGFALRRWGPRPAAGAFLLLFALGGVPNVAELVGFVYEQRQPNFLTHYKKGRGAAEGRYATAYAMAAMIDRQPERSGKPQAADTMWVLVPEKYGRVMTFLTRRYCVEPTPYTALEPRRRTPEPGKVRGQTVYAVEPADEAVAAWAAPRRCVVDPTPVDRAAAGGWTLHRVFTLP